MRGSGVADGPMHESDWAQRRFGERAGELAAAVPARLNQAHLRAQAAHDAAALRKRGPYGIALSEAAREELADEVAMLGGAVREVRGYAYGVINEHALFPWKYADRPLPLDRARLPPKASGRRRMHTAHGPDEQEGLFPVDDSLTSEEYEWLHEAYEELGHNTKLVSVFFTSDVKSGIHVIYWGDARLEPDRTFTWSHVERLT